MKKAKKYLLIALFMGATVIMGLLTFIGPNKSYSENEKRILAEFPQFSWSTIASGEFQDGLEKYIADHLPGRDFFVGTNAYSDKLMGKNTLGDIYSADGGYLINAPKEDSDEVFKKNMQNLKAFTDKTGIDSTLVLIPTAGYIMEDRLPRNHKPYRDDELFKTASTITDNISFFDVRSTLYNSYKEGSGVYYRTDHHLTSVGSYALYKDFCDYLGMSYPSKEEYSIEKIEGFYGTTYSGSGYFLTESDTLEIWDAGIKAKVTFEDNKTSDTMFFKEHLENMDMYPVYLDGNHSYVRIENPSAKWGNILIVRDSYAQNLAPFLSYNYKNIHMLDMRYYRGSMAEFLKDKDIDLILYVYGLDTLITDSSTSWLLI